jgi:hypothetical protein
MNSHTNPVQQQEYPAPFLTPDDTWCLWIDSYSMRQHWSTVVDETVVMRDGTDPTADEVQRWSAGLVDDETGKRFTVNHDTMLAAMQRIVHEGATIRLADSIIDQIAAVLDADDHESATDELCQLDVISDDAIVQVATLGHLIYG